MSTERRLHPRVVLTSPLSVMLRLPRSPTQFNCRVVDYSPGGLLMERLDPSGGTKCQPGDQVEIRFTRRDRAATGIAATVVRVAYVIIAVQFQKADPAILNELHGLVIA